jgi:hypothetical protein
VAAAQRLVPNHLEKKKNRHFKIIIIRDEDKREITRRRAAACVDIRDSERASYEVLNLVTHKKGTRRAGQSGTFDLFKGQ